MKQETRDKEQETRSGQSLIEAIIAITLLTVGFIGVAALLSQSLFLTRIISDQVTATYLASEGIELAKNLIDHDVYAHLATPPQGTGWGSCFANSLSSALAPGATAEYEFDYASTNCNKSYFSGDVLQFDPVTDLYSYAPPAGDKPVATKFNRDIRVAWSVDGTELTVSSIVSWSTGAYTSQSINLEDHFYNWHQ